VGLCPIVLDVLMKTIQEIKIVYYTLPLINLFAKPLKSQQQVWKDISKENGVEINAVKTKSKFMSHS